MTSFFSYLHYPDLDVVMQSCTTRLHRLRQHQETYAKLSLGPYFLQGIPGWTKWVHKLRIPWNCIFLMANRSMTINHGILGDLEEPLICIVSRNSQFDFNTGIIDRIFIFTIFQRWLPTITWNWRRTRDATVLLSLLNTCIINLTHSNTFHFHLHPNSYQR